ncbi:MULTISPECIES: hypothetical protein [Protofrankia]|uniref:Uncharacterized protein n=1 Tax=Protofrankia coriariae TaxID=1562887 RepID=A0ABR5F8K0_9ACTN|nr:MULTISPECIES: hypothetical protein [Protofrankia]KLL13019.1 hypothetical protein FrCorBMG51_00235 [Protofrankia coriariae]ONH38286.1 hypothetical protein BL254_00610 [Protofrankia sp. BMG5.30]
MQGLAADRDFDKRLRVKRFKKIPGVWELTWAPNGRALWQYGEPIPGRPGPHVIWLRIIFKDR